MGKCDDCWSLSWIIPPLRLAPNWYLPCHAGRPSEGLTRQRLGRLPWRWSLAMTHGTHGPPLIGKAAIHQALCDFVGRLIEIWWGDRHVTDCLMDNLLRSPWFFHQVLGGSACSALSKCSTFDRWNETLLNISNVPGELPCPNYKAPRWESPTKVDQMVVCPASQVPKHQKKLVDGPISPTNHSSIRHGDHARSEPRQKLSWINQEQSPGK